MKRILVLFTGGTIGSRAEGTTIDVDGDAGYRLIELFRMNYGQYEQEVEFVTEQAMNILSENATPKIWGQLHHRIRAKLRDEFDGIIITHGSDTLPYTSAALAYLLQDIRIPLILTASNYPLEDSRSNGLQNFASSVEMVLTSDLPGVFTLFGDNQGRNLVCLATRIMEADHYEDQFGCFGGVVFGEVVDGAFVCLTDSLNPGVEELKDRIGWVENESRHESETGHERTESNQNESSNGSEPSNPSIARHENEQLSWSENFCEFEQSVFALRAFPGLDYANLSFQKKPAAILHSLYHSATGCTIGGGTSLPAFIRRCKAEGIDVYLTSFKSLDQALYQTSHELLQDGAIPLSNISFEAAYAKLCVAYNQCQLPAREYMEKNVYYEQLPSESEA